MKSMFEARNHFGAQLWPEEFVTLRSKAVSTRCSQKWGFHMLIGPLAKAVLYYLINT